MGAGELVARIPVVGAPMVRLVRAAKRRRLLPFRDSGTYWEQRYATGGNSGAGSYRRLAKFKADVINDFVRSHGIQSVLEFGCGDGSQLALAEYPQYVGCDVSPSAIALCQGKFAGDPTKAFVLTQDLPRDQKAELTLSLDVIYHLVEDDVFREYMEDLFDHSDHYVVIYSSDEDRLAPDAHVRHRKFSVWVEEFRRDWRLIERVPNAYPFDPAKPDDTSFADFFMFEKVSGQSQ